MLADLIALSPLFICSLNHIVDTSEEFWIPLIFAILDLRFKSTYLTSSLTFLVKESLQLPVQLIALPTAIVCFHKKTHYHA